MRERVLTACSLWDAAELPSLGRIHGVAPHTTIVLAGVPAHVVLAQVVVAVGVGGVEGPLLAGPPRHGGAPGAPVVQAHHRRHRALAPRSCSGWGLAIWAPTLSVVDAPPAITVVRGVATGATRRATWPEIALGEHYKE